MYHPREVVERIHSGCTYCHSVKGKGIFFQNCSNCNIASYCSEECQSKHEPAHNPVCSALRSRYSVTVDTIRLGAENGTMRTFGTHLKGIGEGPKPKHNSRERFIVKIQTVSLNSHPLQLMRVYDKSLTVDCFIQSQEIFNVIMECGVLGKLLKLTSKKVFFWAMFAEKGEKLTVFLDHLASYQEW